MTSHGAGSAEARGHALAIEIRSVNHRHFELKVRGSGLDAKIEDAIAQAIRKRAERGSFSVMVREDIAARRAPLRVDVELARSLFAALDDLRKTVGITEPVTLALLAAQPGVLSPVEIPADPEGTLAALLPAVETALDELVAMRRQEGATLAVDLGARLERIATLATEVEALTRAAPTDHQARLRERIDRLLAGSGVTVDDARIASEVAFFADRTDITEELVRLRSHFAQMRGLFAQDVPVGRRLDFLLQELGREINTIGSKSPSAEIALRVVEAKAELEKIREQAQNVE